MSASAFASQNQTGTHVAQESLATVDLRPGDTFLNVGIKVTTKDHRSSPMPDDVFENRPPVDSAAPLETTTELLTRARNGDDGAIELLFARHIRPLKRFARGRLPGWARNLADTDDLVQDVLLQTFKRLDGFDARQPGALQAYLRQAVLNRVRDELRRQARIPTRVDVDTTDSNHGSPLEKAVGSETMAAYEQALGRLKVEEREAIIGRLEMGFTYEELALALDKPTADAARKAAQRALVHLAEEMQRER